MFFYHNYARLEGEIEQFSKLSCRTALITSGTLRARINTGRYDLSSIVYGPITMRKVIRTFVESKIDRPLIMEEETTETMDTTETTEASHEFENIHALVVEDNEISQKIMLNILKSFSMEVTIATDGKKAFELRREQDYDIIFMDMQMPVLDGLHATELIRDCEKNGKESIPLRDQTQGGAKFIPPFIKFICYLYIFHCRPVHPVDRNRIAKSAAMGIHYRYQGSVIELSNSWILGEIKLNIF